MYLLFYLGVRVHNNAGESTGPCISLCKNFIIIIVLRSLILRISHPAVSFLYEINLSICTIFVVEVLKEYFLYSLYWLYYAVH